MEFLEKRVQDLLAVSIGIINGEDGRKLIDKYRESIDSLTPHDMLEMENRQLERGITTEKIKSTIGKVINIFYKSLSKYEWTRPVEGEFLYYLMEENRELEKRLEKIKTILKNESRNAVLDPSHIKAILTPPFVELLEFDSHYVKKENILFPYLEKFWDSYLPLKVMWSLHDDIRNSLKNILSILQDRWSSWGSLNTEIGKFFFLVYGMIMKEELIIFPVAHETIAKKYWQEMHVRSFEFEFPFITPPRRPEIVIKDKSFMEKNYFETDTGTLHFEQMEIMLNLLPVDITVVDENDRVVYFTRSKERFFPRSSAIIDRKVQNCHPPESVHIVEKIITSFKEGKKNSARFWINVKGRKLLIVYFAMRDRKGEYKGVLETVQDITDIQSLEGEKRLLDWA